MYQLVNFYERGVIKLKRLLVELIETSDEPLKVNINWRDMVDLGPSFHSIAERCLRIIAKSPSESTVKA